jgi:hypothetical protein
MRPQAPTADNTQTTSGASTAGVNDASADEREAVAKWLSAALERRGVKIEELSATERDELESLIAERMGPVLDETVARWREDRGQVSEQERVARELRRRIVAEKELPSGYECEGCCFRHSDHHAFVEFRGLFLCDGCREHARAVLRELQRPLREALATEPTMANAHALGFELIRPSDGRLTWVSEDDAFDGGEEPYADEHEALECLAEELG